MRAAGAILLPSQPLLEQFPMSFKTLAESALLEPKASPLWGFATSGAQGLHLLGAPGLCPLAWSQLPVGLPRTWVWVPPDHCMTDGASLLSAGHGELCGPASLLSFSQLLS